jgi:hypothetical protein
MHLITLTFFSYYPMSEPEPVSLGEYHIDSVLFGELMYLGLHIKGALLSRSAP